jgi:hypothetical protein
MSLPINPWNCKSISQDGFYSGVPLEAYHSGRLCEGSPSLSSSGLRAIFTQSEAHFYANWPLNPDPEAKAAREAEKTSESLILGRATHHLMMGQPNFAREFIVTPEETPDAKGVMQPWTLKFNSAKKWMADRAAERRTVLTPEQVKKIEGMAKRLAREPLVASGVLSGLPEITMAARDKESGVWLLSRPDVIPTSDGDFTDLKTIGRDIVSYPALVRAIAEHGYHQQAALCAEVWEALTGQKLKMFSFFFVETTRPYCARMVALKESTLLLGMRQNRNAIRRFVTALNTGVWPGPGGTQEMVQWIDLSDAKVLSIESELRAQGENDQQRSAA